MKDTVLVIALAITAAFVLSCKGANADPGNSNSAPATCVTCGVSQISGNAIGEVAAVSKSALEGVSDLSGIAKNVGAASLDFNVNGAVNMGSFNGTVKGAADSANTSTIEATNAAKAAADGTSAAVGLGGVMGQAGTPAVVLPALPALPELPKL